MTCYLWNGQWWKSTALTPAVLAKHGIRVGVGAWVCDGARVGDGATVGDGAWVCDGARVGVRATVGARAMVGAGARVGAGATVGDGATVIVIGPIGSHRAFLSVYNNNGVASAVAGCFTGTLDELAAKVEETHGGDTTTTHARDYRAAIAFARIVLEAQS